MLNLANVQSFLRYNDQMRTIARSSGKPVDQEHEYRHIPRKRPDDVELRELVNQYYAK